MVLRWFSLTRQPEDKLKSYSHIWSAPYCKKNFVCDKKNNASIYPAFALGIKAPLVLMEFAHSSLIKSSASIGPLTISGSWECRYYLLCHHLNFPRNSLPTVDIFKSIVIYLCPMSFHQTRIS